MPGETAYVVLDENGNPLERDQTAARPRPTCSSTTPTAVVDDRLGLRRARRQPARADEAPATTLIDRPGRSDKAAEEQTR